MKLAPIEIYNQLIDDDEALLHKLAIYSSLFVHFDFRKPPNEAAIFSGKISALSSIKSSSGIVFLQFREAAVNAVSFTTTSANIVRVVCV